MRYATLVSTWTWRWRFFVPKRIAVPFSFYLPHTPWPRPKERKSNNIYSKKNTTYDDDREDMTHIPEPLYTARTPIVAPKSRLKKKKDILPVNKNSICVPGTCVVCTYLWRRGTAPHRMLYTYSFSLPFVSPFFNIYFLLACCEYVQKYRRCFFDWVWDVLLYPQA